jgi:uncharacterized membrane protein YhhN
MTAGSPHVASASGGFGFGGVTDVGWVFFALAGVLAIIDWFAVSGLAPRAAPLEYVAKPGTLLALIGAVATFNPAVAAEREWFLAGLVCCLIGDVALMLPRAGRFGFAAGLSAFFVAHVLFLVGISVAPGDLAATLVTLAVLLVLLAYPGSRVLRGVLASERALAVPVLAYMAVLLTMAAAAIALGLHRGPLGRDIPLTVGGLVFVVSDTLLSLDRFVGHWARAKVSVHATYHVAVALLCLSLAGQFPR